MTYILNPSKGSTKNKKRIGRGNASGQGRTAGKGHKGYKSRSGTKAKLHFEGGQTPLMRRLPKRGMKIFSKSHRYKYSYQIVNVSDLDSIKETKIDSQVLFDNGLISDVDVPVKILASGDLNRKIEISSNMFSKTAVTKIEKSGGKVIFI
ncbi:MAG: 50S ribosomal protein L15 [Candidatus Marinimicrobia bacterium]|nr:50S ribosomal protein L15 [Candidatus Neomarinimicrobiota bacterium]|tara:strand:+ start:2409 stop:2858 length:450 start_codon:yes stop_codon:yes gene_type:complete